MDDLIGRLVAAEGIDRNAGQGVTRRFIAYTRGKVGSDALGEIAGAVPGLSPVV